MNFKGSSEKYHSVNYSVALVKNFFEQQIGFLLLLKRHIYITDDLENTSKKNKKTKINGNPFNSELSTTNILMHFFSGFLCVVCMLHVIMGSDYIFFT